MIGRVTDLTPLARGGGSGAPPTQTRPLTARGVVAIAPPSEASAMEVVVTTVTRTYSEIVPAGNWSPRGAALPQVGDTCLVVYDDLGDAFVPVWAGTSLINATEINGVAVPLTGAAWITPTLINSWVTGSGDPNPPVAYLKDPLGFVHLRGYVSSGTNDSGAFVLPAGYRPGHQVFAPGVQGGGTAGGYVGVDTGGSVTINMNIATSAGLHVNITPFLAEN